MFPLLLLLGGLYVLYRSSSMSSSAPTGGETKLVPDPSSNPPDIKGSITKDALFGEGPLPTLSGYDGSAFDLGALRDSPHVNDKMRLSEEEIQKLSPMRQPIVNKPLGIAYGTRELPAMIATSRDYHAYRSRGHVPGDLIPIANANHFTILDELVEPNSTLTCAVIAMADYQTT